MSPTLLKTIAFKADLHADSLVDQKPISKKEHRPIPSQLAKKMSKLDEVISISIKKVNKEIQDKKHSI